MELDELKNAWQTLGRQLERHDAISLRMYRDSRLDAARKGLRPLLWGQALQMLLGVALVLLGVSCWTQHTGVPALLATGLLVHAFGVANIAMAAITIGLATSIDYAAPVLEIQRKLARLLRFYGINAQVCAAPWWVMWVLVVVAFVDLPPGAAAPGWITISLGIGVAGLLGTWLYAWLRKRPADADPGKPQCDGGDGIRRSRRILDDIASFERE